MTDSGKFVGLLEEPGSTGFAGTANKSVTGGAEAAIFALHKAAYFSSRDENIIISGDLKRYSAFKRKQASL